MGKSVDGDEFDLSSGHFIDFLFGVSGSERGNLTVR